MYFFYFLEICTTLSEYGFSWGSFLALGLFWGPGGLWAPNMIPLKIFTTLSEYCFLRRRGASRLDGLLIFENSIFDTFLNFAPLSANTAFFGQVGPHLAQVGFKLGPSWAPGPSKSPTANTDPPKKAVFAESGANFKKV